MDLSNKRTVCVKISKLFRINLRSILNNLNTKRVALTESLIINIQLSNNCYVIINPKI